MKKILVAGAGHGGLSAAIILARNGYDVTLFEACNKSTIGHDWDDCMWRKTFDDIGLSAPDKLFRPFYNCAYYGPSKITKLPPASNEESKSLVMINRKELLKYLINKADEAGVNIKFENKIISPIVSGENIIGLNVYDGKKVQSYTSDLVIDACGIDSPVRQQLPNCCGIDNFIEQSQIFYVYRAYFNNNNNFINSPAYTIYLCHCFKTGIDWVNTEKNHIDVLVGSFNKMSMNDVENALIDFKNEYPCIGNTILHGGERIEKIPIRKALPIFICNGYAAVGDSASMTDPLSGSGISYSLLAGRYLAETVLDAGEQQLTTKNLWGYEYKYFSKIGNHQIKKDCTKNLLVNLNPYRVDYLLENKVAGKKEIFGASDKYSVADILIKAKGIIKRPDVIPAFIKYLISVNYSKKAKAIFPKEYSSYAVEKWKNEYNKI